MIFFWALREWRCGGHCGFCRCGQSIVLCLVIVGMECAGWRCQRRRMLQLLERAVVCPTERCLNHPLPTHPSAPPPWQRGTSKGRGVQACGCTSSTIVHMSTGSSTWCSELAPLLLRAWFFASGLAVLHLHFLLAGAFCFACCPVVEAHGSPTCFVQQQLCCQFLDNFRVCQGSCPVHTVTPSLHLPAISFHIVQFIQEMSIPPQLP